MFLTMTWIGLFSFYYTLATAGIFIGNRLTHTISGVKLRKSFGWFVLAVGV